MEQEKIEVDKIEYDQMTKAELVDVCKQQDTQLKNYEIVLNSEKENNKETLTKIQEAYQKQLKDATSLIKYYERKFKLIGDIINIEDGKENK
jgi:diketogulonate reductase-like aldo/keto reductase